MAYTYQLSVSLKHFNLSTDHPIKFAYHITTNALAGHGVDIVRGGDGQIRSINITGLNAQLEQAATDFWGDYLLAGK